MGTKEKSNNSTAPQASSPVECKSTRKRNIKIEPFKHNRIEPFKHKRLVKDIKFVARVCKRKRNIKIEPFKHNRIEPFNHKRLKDTEFFARVCKTVTQAICEFYAQGSTNLPFEHLYRDVYNMVLYRKGDELYTAMETAMTSDVQSLCRSLDAAPEDDTLFLQELLAKWNCHVRAVKMTRDILMYMDRTCIPTNHRKTSVDELGLRLWRDNMARSDKIRRKLIQAVKRQRAGEEELVAGVNKMLMELGTEVMDVPYLCFRDGAGKLHVAGP